MNNAKETVNVVASTITPTSIYFKCPECDPVYHNHGNETRSSLNRETYRAPHCIRKNNICGFNIKITDDTIREGF